MLFCNYLFINICSSHCIRQHPPHSIGVCKESHCTNMLRTSHAVLLDVFITSNYALSRWGDKQPSMYNCDLMFPQTQTLWIGTQAEVF